MRQNYLGRSWLSRTLLAGNKFSSLSEPQLILHTLSMDEQLQLRIKGEASLPTLVYLPGLHGDGTLIGGFLRALGGRVRGQLAGAPRQHDR